MAIGIEAEVLLIEREAFQACTPRADLRRCSWRVTTTRRAGADAQVATFTSNHRRFCDTPLLAWRGALCVAMHGQDALLAQTAHELTSHGGTVEQIKRRTLSRVPCLRPEFVIGSLFEAAAEDVDVHALQVRGLLRGFKCGSGVLRTDTQVVAASRNHTQVGISGSTTVMRFGRRWSWTQLARGQMRWQHSLGCRGSDWCHVVAAPSPSGHRTALMFSTWPTVVGVDEGWYLPDAGRR